MPRQPSAIPRAATEHGRAQLVICWQGVFAWLLQLDKGRVEATIERLVFRIATIERLTFRLDVITAESLAYKRLRGWPPASVAIVLAGIYIHQAELLVTAHERAASPDDADLEDEQAHERLALAFALRAFEAMDTLPPRAFEKLPEQLARGLTVPCVS